MSQNTKTGQRQNPGAKRVFGLLLVAWLNIALQPCAMAHGETSNQNCRNCPPSQSAEASLQGMHKSDHSTANTSCDSEISACVFDNEVNYVGRTVKVKDASDDMPDGVVAPSIAVVPLAMGSVTRPDVGDLVLAGDPRALNVLYCVYLI